MSKVADIESVSRYEYAPFFARDIESSFVDLQILNGVDIDVREDEIVLLFGLNGAGKSTFLRVQFNLLQPSMLESTSRRSMAFDISMAWERVRTKY